MEQYDIVVVGGGLVGSSFCLALADSGLRLALIEARTPSQNDSRFFALNHNSCQFLKNLNLWPRLAAHAASIQAVHISYQRRFGALRLLPKDLHLKELGEVIPAYAMETVLQEKLSGHAFVTTYQPASLCDLSQEDEGVTLTVATSSGIKKIKSKIVVAADGTHSTVRNLLNIKTMTQDYGQKALVARIQLKRAHQQIAYERFTATGTIAMLPLQNDACAAIWTSDADYIDELTAHPDENFLAVLQKEFGYRLGRLQQTGPRSVFPLRLLRAEKNVEQNVILLGNAAHTISPLAAQGFNLALYEAAMLVDGMRSCFVDHKKISSEDLKKIGAAMEKQQSFSIGISHQLTQLFAAQTQPSLDFSANKNKLNRLFGRVMHSSLPLGIIGLDLISPLKKKLLENLLGRAGRQPQLFLENE